MRTMSTPCKNLQSALGCTFGLLCVSDRNDHIGLSPHEQHRAIQPSQCVVQVGELLSITEGRIGGRNQSLLRTGLHALLVELLYECLLNQAWVGEEACEFSAQGLKSRLGMHQAENYAIDLRPQPGAIDQDKSL